MKVLYLINENPKLSPNQYIYSIIKSLEEQKNDFSWEYGVDVIWNNDCFDYEIIHIHWPHVLASSLKKNNKTLDDLYKRIHLIKEKGIKIITTCHNLEPHYCNDKIAHDLYTIIYSYSDYIIHLGLYSYKLFLNKYPSVKHVIIPHHIYDNIYKNILYTKDYCLEVLKLKKNKKYILCFGSFRHKDERNYIINIAKKLSKYNIEIIAPSFNLIKIQRNLIKLSLKIALYLYYKTFHSNIHFENKFISNDMLPIYYGACNLAFIHRLKILNSGNLPMAFLMKKVVVGPNIGNLGYILKETGNPVFELNDEESIISSVLKGIELAERNKGDENYKYSMTNYSSNLIANKIFDLYAKSLND